MVVVDMPFMSYQTSVYDAVMNAGRLMKEGRANAVKLEGGAAVVEQIKAITAAGIPVMGHLGLTPQSINAFGGNKVQGKSEEAAKRHNLPLLAQMPIAPKLAALVDAGRVEEFEGTWLNAAADALEKTRKRAE